MSAFTQSSWQIATRSIAKLAAESKEVLKPPPIGCDAILAGFRSVSHTWPLPDTLQPRPRINQEGVDYGLLTKVYLVSALPERRHSPPVRIMAKETPIPGQPIKI